MLRNFFYQRLKRKLECIMAEYDAAFFDLGVMMHAKKCPAMKIKEIERIQDKLHRILTRLERYEQHTTHRA